MNSESPGGDRAPDPDPANHRARPAELCGLDVSGLFGAALDREPAPASPEWEVAPEAPSGGGGFLADCDDVSLIGRGGMGAVYKARQAKLDRAVAIKVLPRELAQDEAFAGRFRREARLTADLVHPNIVAVYASGETGDGLLYYAMEFVEGEDLARRLAAGRPTVAETVALLCQVCDALTHAHARGIVHRDVKPSNILLTLTGEAKVADFGLAVPESRDPATRLTLTGTTMGTFEYAAPEQLAGGPPTARSDLYSLGVLAYELLTGEVPRGAMEPPSAKGGDWRFDAAVLKALAQDPGKRFATAAEFKAALLRAQAREANIWKLLRRRNLTAAGFGLLAALAAAAGIVALAQRDRAIESQRQATAARADAEDLVAFMLGDLGQKLDRRGQVEVMEDVLEKAEAYYEKSPAAGEADGAKQAIRQAAVIRQKAAILAAQGKHAAALDAYREALALAGNASRLQPRDRAARLAEVHAAEALSRYRKDRGDYRGSLADAEAMQALAGQFAADFPGDAQAVFLCGNAALRIGEAHGYIPDFPQAEEGFLKARALYEQALDLAPGNGEIEWALNYIHAELGSLYEHTDRREECLAEFIAYADGIRAQLARIGSSDDSALGSAEFRIGVAYLTLGKPAEARPALERAMKLAERDAASRPGDQRPLSQLASVYTRLGEALGALGDRAAAEDLARRALRINERLAGEAVADSAGQIDARRRALADGIEALRKNPEPAALRAWNQECEALGKLVADAEDRQSALAFYRDWIARLEAESAQPGASPHWAIALTFAMNRAASLEAELGDHAAAFATYARSLDLRLKSLGAPAGDPAMAMAWRDALSSFGHVIRLAPQAGKYAAAARYAEQAAEFARRAPPEVIRGGNMVLWIGRAAAYALPEAARHGERPTATRAAQALLEALFEPTEFAADAAREPHLEQALREVAAGAGGN